jgi:D-glycero-alpha-D-manno-heptose-7-phosphate kinase
MIISRSPLRVSLGGGGTDLASYYENYGGYFIAGAIDKYVYITSSRPFNQSISLKYSKIESVSSLNDIKHPIIKEVLRKLNLRTPQIEITSIADIPAGTGLGSSGSFTTALIKSVFQFYRMPINTKNLAELACEIEIDILNQPIGKQDQYVASFGGINEYIVAKDGKVTVNPINVSQDTLNDLEDNLLLFYTGKSRSAGEILKFQDDATLKKDASMIDQMHFVKEIGIRSKEALSKGDTKEFGKLMHEHWVSKKNRSYGISNEIINNTYDLALSNGALGGKLVGAGGGGFLMFYASDKAKLRKFMKDQILEETRFKFDFEGTKIIL